MKLPMVFEPGTSWAFSDTNFVLLGQVITKAMGTPYEQLIKTQVYDKVGMPETKYSTGPEIPEPTLHSYSNERGVFEEAAYWSRCVGHLRRDRHVHARRPGALLADWGKGTAAHEAVAQAAGGARQRGQGPAHRGPVLRHGRGVLERLDAHEPADGRVQRRDDFPPKKATVVVWATFRQGGNGQLQEYAGIVFNKMAEIIAPDNPRTSAPTTAIAEPQLDAVRGKAERRDDGSVASTST